MRWRRRPRMSEDYRARVRRANVAQVASHQRDNKPDNRQGEGASRRQGQCKMMINVDNMAIIDGHASIRAINEKGHVAIFQCDGTGDSDHCFSMAEQAAIEAGFTPLPKV